MATYIIIKAPLDLPHLKINISTCFQSNKHLS